MKSAYDSSKTIDADHGAVTILAYRTGWHFGGHTHLAFEYTDLGAYWHVVFHLVALGGQCGQSCTGTTAAILKQVPVGAGRFGFVGGAGAVEKARRRGATITDENREDYLLRPVGDYERNLPNNSSWTTTKYRSRTIVVPMAIAKKGRLICRKMAQGISDDETAGIEGQRFHKTTRSKGTNCVQFALQVLEAIEIQPNWVMKFYARTSPPEAIKLGRLQYIGTT
jgi:hypothetical protein